MKHRRYAAIILLAACGCQSKPMKPVVWIVNSLTQPGCEARMRPPGSKWDDYENGGQVQLRKDGKVRPIPTPDEKDTPSSTSKIRRICSRR